MNTFAITDRSKKQSQTESFLDNRISIKSHSGLHPAECALIENLPRFGSCKKLLIAGNRTGAVAMAASTLFRDCEISCHAYDVHHAAAILRNLKGNAFKTGFVTEEYVGCEISHGGTPSTASRDREAVVPPGKSDSVVQANSKGGVQSSPRLRPTSSAPALQLDISSTSSAQAEDDVPPVTVACTSGLPADSFDNAVFMITPNTVTGELVLNLLEDIHLALIMNGHCLIAYDGEAGAFVKQLRSVFSGIKVLKQDRKGSVFLCTKKEELSCPRNFSAVFEASLPGTERIELLSLPGVFSHRRPDNGGLALAEVTAPLLEQGMKVMDFGCGCGMVGALLALKEPDIHITFVDSSIRAMDATHRNIGKTGLKNTRLILSDIGTEEGGFDIFTGNPPYYSDYRIAELFIDQGYKLLNPGGLLLIVTKQTRKIEELIYQRFGNAEETPRRGYSVVIAKR